MQTTILSSGAPLDAINPSYAGKLGSVRVDFRTALERLSLLAVTSSYDKKNNKTYLAGGPDGDEPTRLFPFISPPTTFLLPVRFCFTQDILGKLTLYLKCYNFFRSMYFS